MTKDDSPIGGTVAPVAQPRNRDRDHGPWKDIDAITVLPDRSLTGCLESKRICPRCGVQNITVHQPDNKHCQVWRLPNGDAWPGDGRPPCVDNSGEVKFQ